MRKQARITYLLTYSNDMFCSSLSSKHTEDAGSTPDVENSLAFEQRGAVENRVTVCPSANTILEHFFVDT